MVITLMPIGLFLAVMATALVWKYTKRRSAPKRSMAHVLGYYMILVLLVLPTVSRRICQTFRCKTYDGEDRLLEMVRLVDFQTPYHKASS